MVCSFKQKKQLRSSIFPRKMAQASINPKAIYGPSPPTPPILPLPLPIHHGELLGTGPAGGLGEHGQKKNYYNFPHK